MSLANIGNIKKSLQKKNVSVSLSKPDTWISTGNYSLNYIMSGNFFKAVPNRRTVMYAGPSGSGKSFLAGNVAVNAQKAGYSVVYIDTENAIDDDFLNKIGVNLTEDWFLPVRASTFEECAIIMSEIFRSVDKDEKLCVIFDSLTNLETEKEIEAFDKSGELKADQGRKAKITKQFIQNINNKVGDRDMFVIFNAHVYANQDVTNGKGRYVISGGEAQIYIPSVTILLTKLKLKEESQVTGIRMKAEVLKSRFNQLGQTTTIEVPYRRGMNPLSGIDDFLEKEGMVTKNGAWFSYHRKDGEVVKFQKKDLAEHFDEITRDQTFFEPEEDIKE